MVSADHNDTVGKLFSHPACNRHGHIAGGREEGGDAYEKCAGGPGLVADVVETVPVVAEFVKEGEVARLKTKVQDDGTGLSPEVTSQLFEAFVTTRPEGSGLGLHITRRIIEQHGGSITAQSAPGAGTCFELLLPASLPAA